jgi:hypothetical protein
VSSSKLPSNLPRVTGVGCVSVKPLATDALNLKQVNEKFAKITLNGSSKRFWSSQKPWYKKINTSMLFMKM